MMEKSTSPLSTAMSSPSGACKLQQDPELSTHDTALQQLVLRCNREVQLLTADKHIGWCVKSIP